MSTHGRVESALQDCLGYSRLRFLAPRSRFRRLYFQLRGDGLKRKEARRIVSRARRALPGLRKAPDSLAMAVDLAVA